MVLNGAGLRISEAPALELVDVDSARMLLTVRQGKGDLHPSLPADHPRRSFDFDQSPGFDPTEGDSGPHFDFDQSLPDDLDD